MAIKSKPLVKCRPRAHATQKTAEQQARKTDMLKTMLMRQQPGPPAIVQQNDRMQQQLESLNNAYKDYQI